MQRVKSALLPVDPSRACPQAPFEAATPPYHVIEVIPTAIGSADVTALTADRIVREILTGLALRQTNQR